MAAYMGVMVWDGLEGGGDLLPPPDGTPTDADKWFDGRFTEEDTREVDLQASDDE